MPEFIGTFGLRSYVFYEAWDFVAAHTIFRKTERKGFSQERFEDNLEEAEIDFDYDME